MLPSIDGCIDWLTQPVVQTFGQPNHLAILGHAFQHDFKVVQPYSKTIQSSACLCYIIPPHMSSHLHKVRSELPETIRNRSIKHNQMDDSFRVFRETILTQQSFTFHWPFQRREEELQPPSTIPENTTSTIDKFVYDAQHKRKLPGKFVISVVNGCTEGHTTDSSARQALDNASHVSLFYLTIYKYNSIDGHGISLTSTIHFGFEYENAFWNGHQMVYGDGSALFDAFVNYLDIVGHEMTHGVVGNRLEYQGEAGALNEHFADVMGYLVFLYIHRYKVNDPKTTWTIAEGILREGKKRFPLRSFASPGTAYDSKMLGKDPQVAKYGDLYKGKEDNGGVHINSGIPNHAFYLFAMELGGFAWEKAGLIWFITMLTPGLFKPNTSMSSFAQATIQIASKLFPDDTNIDKAIRRAWKRVEVIL